MQSKSAMSTLTEQLVKHMQVWLS